MCAYLFSYTDDSNQSLQLKTLYYIIFWLNFRNLTLLNELLLKENLQCKQNFTLLMPLEWWLVLAIGPGDLGSIPGQVITKTQKMVLDAGLILSIIRYGSRVKWNNSGKGVVPSHTLWCCSYRKGSLRVSLVYGCQLYNFTYKLLNMVKMLMSVPQLLVLEMQI